MAAPHILVRIVQGPRGQLAEQGQVVVRHPGGEETVSLPAPSQVHRLDGPSGDYALEIQRLQAGSYSGALLVLGLAPATDLAAAGLALA
jgi:hypothetical protein